MYRILYRKKYRRAIQCVNFLTPLSASFTLPPETLVNSASAFFTLPSVYLTLSMYTWCRICLHQVLLCWLSLHSELECRPAQCPAKFTQSWLSVGLLYTMGWSCAENSEASMFYMVSDVFTLGENARGLGGNARRQSYRIPFRKFVINMPWFYSKQTFSTLQSNSKQTFSTLQSNSKHTLSTLLAHSS